MKKIFLIIFLLVNLPLFAIELEDDAYIQALETYNKNDYEKAKKLFDDFLQKFPESKYKPNILLKRTQLENDFNKTINMYDEIIRNYGGKEIEIEAIYLKGLLLFSKGKYQESTKEFEKILINFSESIWTEPSFYYLLLNHYKLKNYEKAKELYDKYINAQIYNVYKLRMDYSYANVLFAQGKYSEAVELYKNLLDKIQVDDKTIHVPYVYLQIIECYKKKGDNTGAEKYKNELNEKFPSFKEFSNISDDDIKNGQKIFDTPDNIKNTVFFTVQIGAYTNRKISEYMYKKMKDKKYSVFMRNEGNFIKIQIGKFKTEKEADEFAKDLIKKEKLNSYLIKQIE